MQGLEKGAKIERGQPRRALPLTALICLQSSCSLASRSFIGNAQSASRRSLAARVSESPFAGAGSAWSLASRADMDQRYAQGWSPWLARLA